eukprot:120610-Pyramimonas_sp.AAC.1
MSEAPLRGILNLHDDWWGLPELRGQPTETNDLQRANLLDSLAEARQQRAPHRERGVRSAHPRRHAEHEHAGGADR